MFGADVGDTYLIAFNAMLFVLCAALPALLIGFVRHTIVARRLPSGFSLGKLEELELDRATLMYDKVLQSLKEIDGRGHDATASLWRRYRLRAEVRRQYRGERRDLEVYGRHLRSAIVRLRGLPIKRFRNRIHVVSARFASGLSVAIYATVMASLMAIFYLEETGIGEKIWSSLEGLLLWKPVDERLLYANWAAATFGLMGAPLFYFARRARLHSFHRHQVRDLKEFAAIDPDRLVDRREEQASAEQKADGASTDQDADQKSNRTDYEAHRESAGRSRPFEAPPEDEWHVVLGVSRFATADEIRQAYRAQIKQSHPDRVHGMSSIFKELAESETKRLNTAYEEALMALRPFEDAFSDDGPSYTRH